MTRRRVILIGAVACLLAALPFGAPWALAPVSAPGITLENFGRLHDRMNMEEIEAILGGPAPDGFAPFAFQWTSKEGTVYLGAIASREREIIIGYSGTFTTPEGKTFWIATSSDNILVKLRRWLGR